MCTLDGWATLATSSSTGAFALVSYHLRPKPRPMVRGKFCLFEPKRNGYLIDYNRNDVGSYMNQVPPIDDGIKW